MLTFTYPVLAIAGAAAVSIPITIHLPTLWRRRPQPWGAMRFVLEAYRRHRSRLQVERWLLLLVRCLILALLGAALAGPMLASDDVLPGFAKRQRLVYLLIDDSLSTQAHDMDDQTRSQSLRLLAKAVLNELDSADEVSLWRIGRPAKQILSATQDHQAAHLAIASLEPRASRGDLLEALVQIHADVQHRQWPADRVFVVLLSDFTAKCLPLDRAVPSEIRQLGQAAQFLVTYPKPALDNVQIQQFSTSRRKILLERSQDAWPTVPLELTLKRYVDKDSTRPTTVTLTTSRQSSGEVISTIKRRVNWSVGQSVADVQVEIPLLRLFDDEFSPSNTDRPKVADLGLIHLQASIDPTEDAISDAIDADNTRSMVVELRNRLNVALIDSWTHDAVNPSQDFPPQRWLELALTPWESPSLLQGHNKPRGSSQGIEILPIEPSQIDRTTIENLDAVFVLRPDLVTDAGWQVLHRFVTNGGLLWVTAAKIETPHLWGQIFTQTMEVDWMVGLEPQITHNSQTGGWSLSTNRPTPKMLNLLAADWPVLLRPVRIYKTLPLEVKGPSDNIWLETDDGKPVLASETIGDGRLFLQSTAMDPEWTNLPTKPLFVPLLHEALRGAISQANRGGAITEAVCGDQPKLGTAWQEATQLTRITASKASQPIKLRPVHESIQPSTSLDEPGLYVAQPPLENRLLTVNPDAEGGDTRAMNRSTLEKWLSAVGSWQWLNPADPGKPFKVEKTQADLTWPLLWTVLGLIVIEMALSRWFSHGGTGPTRITGTLAGPAGRIGNTGKSEGIGNRRDTESADIPRVATELSGSPNPTWKTKDVRDTATTQRTTRQRQGIG